jgi:excinuclease UvrABC ATPase subunit
MLYSRTGKCPTGQPHLEAESFSPNTPEGACPKCHGLGRIHEVTEASMVPDLSLTISTAIPRVRFHNLDGLPQAAESGDRAL